MLRFRLPPTRCRYFDHRRLVLNEPAPAEVTNLLARRCTLGLGRHDEVWSGEQRPVQHVTPSDEVHESHLLDLSARAPADQLDWATLAAQCPGDCFETDGFRLRADGSEYYTRLISEIVG